MRKPADLAYGLDDRPPLRVLLTAALQQTAIIVVFIYPAILIGRAVDAPPREAAAILSLTFLTCGLSTLLQAFGRGGFGSGFLAPGSAAGGFLAPSLLAAQNGGLPMVAGMTMAAGAATLVFARMLRRLRAVLPPEIAGTVALIIALVIALTGVRLLMHGPEGEPPTARGLFVAAVTLAVAGGLSVWGKGMLRWTCVLVALAVGSLVALALGETDSRASVDLATIPLVGLPQLGHIGYDFDIALLPAFLVTALAAAVRSVGLLTTLQKINDADWVRPDQRSIAGGVSGDGVTILIAGLLAAPAANMSTTNITVQGATGITSRIIALGTAGACFLLACFPRAAALLAQVPAPVIAAILLQAGAQMMVNGMQLATSRMLDARKTLAIGLAFITALGVAILPEMRDLVAPSWRPLVSEIALGTIVAIGLNALLRIGIRRRVSLTVPGDAIDEKAVADFATRAGASWGARPDVVARTTELVSWCLDAIIDARLARGDITVTLAFDEFRLDVLVAYHGAPIELAAAPPSPEELLQDDGAGARLAGHMIRRRASRATVRHRDGLTELRLVVDH
ncbi:uracil-xanthine permease family protein [Falsiroseomonas bella]|nr:solute carrier family 23 protein [Falsiroseomonas bella]